VIDSNLKKRIIPSILVNNYQVVKSKCFKDHRIFGNLIQTVELFCMRKVDELVILDIDTSKKKLPIDSRILNLMTSNSLIPITYGGGIKTLFDIEKCLETGCEKVILNSVLFEDKTILDQAVKNFGSQSIIVNIDIKSVNHEFKIYNHSKYTIEKIELDNFINFCHDYNCGEITVNSVDNDGLMQGYRLDLLKKLRSKINKPLIINGGCGQPSHMKDAIELGADACMGGSIFFFSRYSYSDIKKFLFNEKVNIRI
jgi:cyclase